MLQPSVVHGLPSSILSETIALAVAVHPFASVTVTVNVLTVRFVAVAVVAPEDHRYV